MVTRRTPPGAAGRTTSSVAKRKRPNPVIAAAIKKCVAMLEAKAPEEQIRRFLATHLYFWNGLVRAGEDLYTKIKLGDQFEIDFVWCDPSSSGAEWHFAELERPGASLFTRAGDPSKVLSHTMRQVRDWQDWILRNVGYAEKKMPGVYQPMGHIFMGRRAELVRREAREHLRAINAQSRGFLHVYTLDRFAAMARSVLTWKTTSFSPKALSDRELRRGLPEDVVAYIRSWLGSSHDFVEEREWRDHFDDFESERSISREREVEGDE